MSTDTDAGGAVLGSSVLARFGARMGELIASSAVAVGSCRCSRLVPQQDLVSVRVVLVVVCVMILTFTVVL